MRILLAPLLCTTMLMMGCQTAPETDGLAFGNDPENLHRKPLCVKLDDESLANRICDSTVLSKYQKTLAETYQSAVDKSGKEQALARSQRQWQSSVSDCWRHADVDACISDKYQERIATLQARYKLVPVVNKATFMCLKNRPLKVAFFDSLRPALVADYQGAQVAMVSQKAASGTRYTSGNREYWEHQGEVTLKWNGDKSAQTCTKN